MWYYLKYVLLFVRMSFKDSEDEKIQKSHRWRVVRICKLSVYRVLLFQKNIGVKCTVVCQKMSF